MISVRFFGLRRFRNEVDAAGKKFPTVVGQKMAEASEVVLGLAQKQFKGNRTRALRVPPSGRMRKYPRPVTSPPDKLGIWLGTYRKQITYDVSRRNKRSWRSEIGPTGIPYARVHELGIGTMPRRPVMGPAVEKSERKVIKILGTSFRVVFR